MKIHSQKRKMIWINLVGGAAVLVSYAHSFLAHPMRGNEFWGGVPDTLRPLYGVCMVLATAGYFVFTYLLLFRVDAARARIAGRFGFGVFHALYLVILVPSALWTPLTFAMLTRPSDLLWLAIRLALALVGLGSLGLIGALLTLRPRPPTWLHWMAVAGSLAFTVQTALLDALIWPAYFPR